MGRYPPSISSTYIHVASNCFVLTLNTNYFQILNLIFIITFRYGLALSNAKHSVLFVFYPFARTMRTNHYYGGKHHHRFYSDFRAGGHNLFQLTIKIKRNR